MNRYRGVALSVLLLASVSFVWPASVAAQPATASNRVLRVISYNILEGFRNQASDRFPSGADRKKAVSDWLDEQQPDVVAFQELNGYTAERLREEAAAWGHSYAETVKDGGYIVGVTSKSPIEVIERHLDGMHHGLLHVRSDTVDFFIVHLSPFKYEHRQREVAMILERVNRVRDAGGQAVVLGDFNALSPLDREHHTSEQALERARQREQRHAHIRNLNQGRVDYSVMGAILESGLVDTDAKHPDDYDEVASRRIDYIFASPNLARRSVAAHRMVNKKFARMSDHYPVVADFHR